MLIWMIVVEAMWSVKEEEEEDEEEGEEEEEGTRGRRRSRREAKWLYVNLAGSHGSSNRIRASMVDDAARRGCLSKVGTGVSCK